MKKQVGAVLASLLAVASATAQTSSSTTISNEQSTQARAGSPQNLGRIFTRPLPPTRAQLDPLGLVMAWHTYVPMGERRDGILTAQLFGNQLFVQSRSGMIEAIDANDGTALWRAQPGMPYRATYPLGYNSQSVFAVRGTLLCALDRVTGGLQWQFDLPEMPNATPVADEERLYAVLGTGRLQVYALPGVAVPVANAPAPAPTRPPATAQATEALTPQDQYREMRSREGIGLIPPPPMTRAELEAAAKDPYRLMRLQENIHGSIGPLSTATSEAQAAAAGFQLNPVYDYTPDSRVEQPPLLMARTVVLASHDGGFVVLDRETKKVQFAFRAEAAIAAPVSQHGGTAYVASSDFNVYAIDAAAGQVLWRFIGGAPIMRRPVPNDVDLFVSPEEFGLFRLDRKTGRMIWHNGDVYRMRAVNRKFVYADDRHGRVILLDRARGTSLGMLDSRDFVVPVTNDITDRVFLAANDGLVVCLHDREYPAPLVVNREAFLRSGQTPQLVKPPAAEQKPIPAPVPKKEGAPAEQPPKDKGGSL